MGHPLIESYFDWLATNVPEATKNLAPPASDEDINNVQQAVGHEIPSDVVAMWRVHNGQNQTMLASDLVPGTPCLPTLSFLSTHAVATVWTEWADMRSSTDPTLLEELNEACSVFPGAKGKVKPLYTSPGWIPLWADPTRPDYIGVDLDPDEQGQRGQIINFGRNEDRHFVLANVGELLSLLVEEVQSGAWTASEMGYADGTIPWFGPPSKSFFSAVYKRFKQSSDTAPIPSTAKRVTKTVARRSTTKKPT